MHEKPTVISADLVMFVRRVTGIGVMNAKRLLKNASPVFYSRYMEAVLVAQKERTEEDQERNRSVFLRDPLQDDPQFATLFEEASRLANAEIGALQLKGQYGEFHLYNLILQRILRDNYGVEWFTWEQMNPHLR